MKFEQALALLREGKHITRQAWPKNHYIKYDNEKKFIEYHGPEFFTEWGVMNTRELLETDWGQPEFMQKPDSAFSTKVADVTRLD